MSEVFTLTFGYNEKDLDEKVRSASSKIETEAKKSSEKTNNDINSAFEKIIDSVTKTIEQIISGITKAFKVIGTILLSAFVFALTAIYNYFYYVWAVQLTTAFASAGVILAGAFGMSFVSGFKFFMEDAINSGKFIGPFKAMIPILFDYISAGFAAYNINVRIMANMLFKNMFVIFRDVFGVRLGNHMTEVISGWTLLIIKFAYQLKNTLSDAADFVVTNFDRISIGFKKFVDYGLISYQRALVFFSNIDIYAMAWFKSVSKTLTNYYMSIKETISTINYVLKNEHQEVLQQVLFAIHPYLQKSIRFFESYYYQAYTYLAKKWQDIKIAAQPIIEQIFFIIHPYLQQAKRAFEKYSFYAKEFLVDNLKKYFPSLFTAIAAVNESFNSLRSGAINVIDFTKAIGNHFKHATGNIFEFLNLTNELSVIFFGLGTYLAAFEIPMVNFIGRIMQGASAVTGFVSVIASIAIVKLGAFSFKVGTELVEAFQKAQHAFIEFRKEGISYTRTLENFNRISKGSIGFVDDWDNSISNLGESLNFATGELRKTVTEIVQTGYRIGLTRQQMEQLLQVSAEYAKLTGKDLFDTSVNFIQALTGQSTAVLSYGVKLTEASNAHFALTHGMEKSFSQMSDNEQVQLRFNNLLDQYSNIQGIAVEKANDFTAQTEKLDVKLKNLAVSFGKGVNYIEDLSFGAGILNKALSLVGDTTATVAGVFSALGARTLQIGGLFLEYSFKVMAVVSAYNLLNVAIKTNLINTLANKTIPILNASFIEMMSAITGTKFQLKGINSLLTGLGSAMIRTTKISIESILGLQANTLSFTTFITGSFTRILSLLASFGTIMKGLIITSGPFLIKAAGIAAALYVVYQAFVKLEERTKIFSLMLDGVSQTFDRVWNSTSALAPVLNMISSVFRDVLGVSIGLVLNLLSLFSTAIAKIIAINPGNIFSKELSDNMKVAANNLDNLNQGLVSAKFNLFNLKNSAIAALNPMKDPIKIEVDPEALKKLDEELKDVGKSELQKAKELYASRLKLNDDAKKAGVASEIEWTRRLIKANQDYELKVAEINSRIAKDRAQGLESLKSKLESTLTELNNQGFNSIIQLEKQTADRDKVLLASYNRGILDQQSYLNYKIMNQTAYNDKLAEIKDSEGYIIESMSKHYDVSLKNAKKYYDAAKDIANGIEKVVVGFVETAGATLVNGQTAWSDFTAFVLDTIGTLMINLGVAGLGISQAIAGLAASIASLNPFAATAASIALIAAGGAFKALAAQKRGQGNSASGTTSASLPANAGGEQSTVEVMPRPDRERQEPQPNFVINIDGNYYHTDETAKSLIELINKEFDKRGTKFRRGALA